MLAPSPEGEGLGLASAPSLEGEGLGLASAPSLEGEGFVYPREESSLPVLSQAPSQVGEGSLNLRYHLQLSLQQVAGPRRGVIDLKPFGTNVFGHVFHHGRANLPQSIVPS